MQIPYDGLAALPDDVELVWHDVNDAANLRQFLSADVLWGELDLNVDVSGQELILRHDSYDELSGHKGRFYTYSMEIRQV